MRINKFTKLIHIHKLFYISHVGILIQPPLSITRKFQAALSQAGKPYKQRRAGGRLGGGASGRGVREGGGGS